MKDFFKKKKNIIILTSILAVLIIIAGVICAVKYYNNKQEKVRENNQKAIIAEKSKTEILGEDKEETKKEYEENYEIGLKKDCNIFVPEEYLQDYKNALGTDYIPQFGITSSI